MICIIVLFSVRVINDMLGSVIDKNICTHSAGECIEKRNRMLSAKFIDFDQLIEWQSTCDNNGRMILMNILNFLDFNNFM